MGQRKAQSAEGVVQRHIAAADLLAGRVVRGDRKVCELVPQVGRQVDVNLHALRPTWRAHRERLGRLSASGDRVCALDSNQPVRKLSGDRASEIRGFETVLSGTQRHGAQLGTNGGGRGGKWRRDHIQLVYAGDEILGADNDRGGTPLLAAEIDVLRCSARRLTIRLIETRRCLLSL